MAPATQVDEVRRVVKPKPPQEWPTGIWHWVRKEGVRWGVYWAVRSRWINAVGQAAYYQRIDEWERARA